MAILRRARPVSLYAALYCAALGFGFAAPGAVAAEATTEYQVKAVFLFNFSHFVEWPPRALGAPNEPLVIGILGNDPFGARLDEAVRGERIDQHPLLVRRLRDVADIAGCHILYIDRSENGQLSEILAALDHRSTLTVSDLERASERGVMIQFTTENNRIRLRINPESARAAGLTISSKLLRPAEIVGASGEQ